MLGALLLRLLGGGHVEQKHGVVVGGAGLGGVGAEALARGAVEVHPEIVTWLGKRRMKD